MKILDFDLEGSHFIIEADISPRQEADDDMECQWLQCDFENTQVYKETDGVVSPFQITAVAWAGYQLTADHALKDVIGRISRNETGKLTVHYVCPELQEFFDELKKYPAINGERTIPYFIFHDGDIARLAYATNEFLYYEDSNYKKPMIELANGWYHIEILGGETLQDGDYEPTFEFVIQPATNEEATINADMNFSFEITSSAY